MSRSGPVLTRPLTGLLAGSSLARTKLNVKPSRVNFKPTNYSNTTSQWDLYGSDAPSPYNPLQSKFFETFAAPFTKRGLLLNSEATGDVLPIVKGPQLPPKLGPRGKI
ncbi:hypothetical protein ACJIZ3_025472 [Penstemon smallii]|uniref:Photosystem I reaction center subunit VI n=1 Tax=Penstemon smallii TaxID=265156 RepID=A0ABD3TW23_9LAMI